MNNKKLVAIISSGIAILICLLSIMISYTFKNDIIKSKHAIPPIMQNTDILNYSGKFISLNTPFINHNGITRTLSHYFKQNKAIILTLGYYKCPMLCNLLLNALSETIQNIHLMIGQNFNIISISINHNENYHLAQQKRKNYLTTLHDKSLQSNDNIWPFLTGNKNNINLLTQQIGFQFKYDIMSKEYIHSAGVFLLSSQGQIIQIFYGIQFDADKITKAIINASNQKVTSKVDKLILSCFHYFSDSHRYGTYIFKITKFIALTILFLLFILIVIMKYLERKNIRNTNGKQQ